MALTQYDNLIVASADIVLPELLNISPYHDLFEVVAPTSGGAAANITNLIPPDLTTISPKTPIQFDVLEATPGIAAFSAVWVYFMGYEDGIVVFDGTSFVGRFAKYSQRIAITGGYRYVLVCDNGWPGSITGLVVKIVSTSGQIVSS